MAVGATAAWKNQEAQEETNPDGPFKGTPIQVSCPGCLFIQLEKEKK
jgi:hypothetical protein